MLRTLLVVAALAAVVAPVSAQIIEAPFATDYSFVDLGTVPMLPPNAGGLTFVPGNPNQLLIGGAANGLNGKIYSIGLTRDASQHVNGFSGTATFVATAAGIGSGGIDGGLAFGPSGILFYTSYSDNSLGQIKPGSTSPDLQIALTALGIASSVGTLAFVPAGFPGAGRFKLVQYTSPGNWYDVVLGSPHANGTYPISSVTLKATIGFGPEGVIYVSDDNPQFANASALVSEYSAGSMSAYEIDANGDPIVATRRVFMTGLSGAEGATIDPLTGDFLFSTFGGSNRVIVVTGFVAPSTTSTSSTTSTTAAPTTSSSSSAPLSTTTSSTSTSSSTTSTTSTSSSSTAPVPTTTTTSSSAPATTTTTSSSAPATTTLPSGECAAVPPGPTFASIVCRLADLADATNAADALGKLQPKLLVPLGKARDRADDGDALCASSDLKRSKNRLKQVARQLTQYSHRLRGKPARQIPAEVRDPLTTAAAAIGADAKTLRGVLTCPDDATGT